MAITEKKPSVKYTVGAQYICFNLPEFAAGSGSPPLAREQR